MINAPRSCDVFLALNTQRTQHAPLLTQGAGIFLLTVAPIANLTTIPPSQSSPESWRGGACKSTDADDKDSDNDLKAAKLHGCFEPFVQLASWGHGHFDPLAQFTLEGLRLGGGGATSGGEGVGVWSPPPGAPQNISKDRGRYGRSGSHAILTRDGSLDIVSAGDLHLRSGKAQRSVAGGRAGEGGVHTAASGKHGTIRLGSDSLEWSSRPPSLPPSTSTSGAAERASEHRDPRPPHSRNASSFLRIDADSMEAGRFLDRVSLSAAHSFDLSVVDGGSVPFSEDDEESKKGHEGEHTGANHVQGESEGQAPGQRSSLTARGLKAALFRGDTTSMNASAGVVNVKATDTVLMAGGNRARLASSSGDVILDATGANGSVVLAGGSAILGASRVVYFTAGPASMAATLAGASNAKRA